MRWWRLVFGQPLQWILRCRLLLRIRTIFVLFGVVVALLLIPFTGHASEAQNLPPEAAAAGGPAPGPAVSSPQQQPASSKAAEGWFKNPNAVRSAPRRVTLPAFETVDASQLFTNDSGATKLSDWPRGRVYEYQMARFSVLFAMASWSSRSEDVARRLQSWAPEFAKRSITIVGIFSHDAPEDIRAVMKRNQFSFRIAKASLDFISQLLNPKVPTLWVADHTGQLVMRLERPTDGQLDGLRQKMLEWTDF